MAYLLVDIIAFDDSGVDFAQRVDADSLRIKMDEELVLRHHEAVAGRLPELKAIVGEHCICSILHHVLHIILLGLLGFCNISQTTVGDVEERETEGIAINGLVRYDELLVVVPLFLFFFEFLLIDVSALRSSLVFYNLWFAHGSHDK